MRKILEAYRWVTLVAFCLSFLMIMVPVFAFFAPGYHVESGPWAVLGFAATACTFAFSGFNVIMISIYDQLRTLTNEAAATRSEVAFLRDHIERQNF